MDIRVLLCGPYRFDSTGTMNSYLVGNWSHNIADQQPFNIEPWNYNGTEATFGLSKKPKLVV